MRKLLNYMMVMSVLGIAGIITANAQTDTIKKVGTATKETTVAGAKTTGKGVKKGWGFSKKTGKVVWNGTKKAVKKIT